MSNGYNHSQADRQQGDVWEAEIGQIVIRFGQNKPKAALSIWQGLVAQISNLLDERMKTKAEQLWRMLLDTIPVLLKTEHTAETQVMWGSLLEKVMETNAGGHRETASLMWKMMLDRSPKLLKRFPTKQADQMWTELDHSAEKMKSAVFDPELTPLPVPPLSSSSSASSTPTPPPSPTPSSGPTSSSTPRSTTEPKSGYFDPKRTPLPPLPESQLPQLPPKFLPQKPRPESQPTRSPPQLLPVIKPKPEFQPTQSPLIKPKPHSQPAQSPPQLLPVIKPKPQSQPAQIPLQLLELKPLLPPKLRPTKTPPLEVPKPKPPILTPKPKSPLTTSQKLTETSSSDSPTRPNSKPAVRPKPLLVIPNASQANGRRLSDQGWSQGMQDVLTELSHKKGIGTVTTNTTTTTTTALAPPRQTLMRPVSWTSAGTVPNVGRWLMSSASLPDDDTTTSATDTPPKESADGVREARMRSSASFTYAPPPGEDPPAVLLRNSPRSPGRPRVRPPSVPASPAKSPGMGLLRPPSTVSLPAQSSSSPSEPPLWFRLPEVVDSGVLEGLSGDQRTLQEALFEIISSEASYRNSLQLLQRHFQEPLRDLSQTTSSPESEERSPPSQDAFSEDDFHELFHHVDEVFQCSSALLSDMERIQQADVLLSGLCEAVHTHTKSNLHPYKVYCAQKVHQDRKLKQLTSQNGQFAALLSRLEASPEVRGMSLSAYLHLPVQRVQRLPLLMATVQKHMPADHTEREHCDEAHQALIRLAQHCDEDYNRELQRLEAQERQENSNGDANKTTRVRLSWRRRGVRRHSGDEGSIKKGS